KITMKFNQDVGPSLQASDLVVHNKTTNTDISPGTLFYDPATKTAVWTLGAAIPDGNYTASLASKGVQDAAGNSVTPVGLDFFWLNGDLDRDRTVGFADLVIIAQHYGQVGGATYATGDATGDGDVGF